ncbi:MAG: Hpt domain-containing protein [Bdellovibrionales bacterium]|nr:Hpt domain-containing protein [Massilia sp.]
MSEDAKVLARVDMLGKIFKGRLHVRFAKIEEAFALCQTGGDSDEHWRELHRLLHSLGEAAGSFGFDELGARAIFIELRVMELLSEPDKHRHDIEEIAQALAALQSSPV